METELKPAWKFCRSPGVSALRLGACGCQVSWNRDSRVDSAERLFKYKVIFFRGQEHLDEASHEAFGRLLGDIVPHPTVPSVKGTEAVLDIDGTHGNRATAWHTDVTFVDAYPQASILRALIVPTHGGDTAWANTATAYESLPPKLQEIANNLWAVHSATRTTIRCRRRPRPTS